MGHLSHYHPNGSSYKKQIGERFSSYAGLCIKNALMKNPSGYKKEQIMGVEPTPSAWEADVLPIYYICLTFCRI